MNEETGSALRIRLRACACAFAFAAFCAVVSNASGRALTNAPEVIAPSNVSMLQSRFVTRFQGNVKTLNSSADGKVLAVWTIGQDMGASVVDTTTGRILTRILSAQLPIALSADGGFLASGPDASLWFGLNGWQRGKQLDHYAQPGSLRDIAFSPEEFEDSVLAVATTQSTTIWAPPGPNRIGSDGVSCNMLALSRDSTRLACYAANSTLTIWNALRLTRIASKVLPALANNERLDLLRFGAVDPVQIYIGTNRRTFRVSYSDQTGWIIKDLNIPVPLVAISTDGSIGVSVGNYVGHGPGGYSPLTFWDLSTSRPLAKKDNPDIPIAFTFSEDGRNLFTGTVDGEVVVWSVQTAQPSPSPSGLAPASVSTPAPPSSSGNVTPNFAGTWQATQMTLNGEDRPVTGMQPITITQTGSSVQLGKRQLPIDSLGRMTDQVVAGDSLVDTLTWWLEGPTLVFKTTFDYKKLYGGHPPGTDVRIIKYRRISAGGLGPDSVSKSH